MKLKIRKVLWHLPFLVIALTFSQVTRAQEAVDLRHTEHVADAAMQLLTTRLTDALSLITTGAYRGNEERLQRESVKAVCFYETFKEFKDVYLSLLEVTPLDLNKIAGAENFGRFLAQIDHDSSMLETFFPSITNIVQTEIERRRLATPMTWSPHARALGITTSNIHDGDFGTAINYCKTREFVDVIVARLTSAPPAETTTYSFSAPLEFVNWEHTINGGIRPVFRNPNVQCVSAECRVSTSLMSLRSALVQISSRGN